MAASGYGLVSIIINWFILCLGVQIRYLYTIKIFSWYYWKNIGESGTLRWKSTWSWTYSWWKSSFKHCDERFRWLGNSTVNKKIIIAFRFWLRKRKRRQHQCRAWSRFTKNWISRPQQISRDDKIYGAS